MQENLYFEMAKILNNYILKEMYSSHKMGKQKYGEQNINPEKVSHIFHETKSGRLEAINLVIYFQDVNGKNGTKNPSAVQSIFCGFTLPLLKLR